MTMTRAGVQDWLDRYVEGWRTYDQAIVEDLFADDAEYRYHPWDEPVRGRAAIVDNWLNPSGPASSRDEPGTWKAHYEPFAVDGDRAVVVGETWYYADASQAVEERHYWNIWTIEFDAASRCRSFTESFMQRRKPA